MSTTRPFAFNNTGTTYSNTVQYGNITVANEGCDLGAIPLEWYNGCDEDPGYVIAHAAGQRNIGNNSYVSNGNVVGFWRSTAKTEGSFYNLYESFRNRTGWPYMATAADAKNWLLNNGYWTSYTGSGGGGTSSGNYVLLNVYSPASSNGQITFPSNSGPSNDPNTVGLNPGNGIYINKYDSNSIDSSSILDLLIGRSGTLTLTQGSNSVTYTFTSTAFNFTTSNPYANQYWWDNFHNGGQSPLNTLTVTSPASSNFNYVDPIVITVT